MFKCFTCSSHSWSLSTITFHTVLWLQNACRNSGVITIYLFSEHHRHAWPLQGWSNQRHPLRHHGMVTPLFCTHPLFSWLINPTCRIISVTVIPPRPHLPCRMRYLLLTKRWYEVNELFDYFCYGCRWRKRCRLNLELRLRPSVR